MGNRREEIQGRTDVSKFREWMGFGVSVFISVIVEKLNICSVMKITPLNLYSCRCSDIIFQTLL